MPSVTRQHVVAIQIVVVGIGDVDGHVIPMRVVCVALLLIRVVLVSSSSKADDIHC